MTQPNEADSEPESSLGVGEAFYVFGEAEDVREVLNHLHAGVVAHAADTSIRVCNPRACQILGLTMDQMIGVTAIDPKWMFLREDGSIMPLEEFPVSVVLGTGGRLNNLVVGVTRPAMDDIVWARCNGYPVFDDAGELQLAIITFIDVTELRQAEQEKERLQAQLRQAVKMEAIGRLAGGVAHDFNNILTAILGYSELVERALDDDHPARSFATEIRQGGERAAELTQQLLAFARKQVVEPVVMQVNDVVARSEKMLTRIIGEDVELVVRPQADLWNIRADPGQVDQILVNLVVNARDAMPGGGRLCIETHNVVLDDEHQPIGVELSGSRYVMLAISDDGAGMDSQTRERIFEPFFSTKGPGHGTGLGLATVYGIVKQNQGKVTVYSEPDHGTTFKIYLPAVFDDVDAGRPDSDRPVSRGQATVLLVEDDSLVRELARRLLSDQGYTVLEAADGEEALMLSERFSGSIALLVSDVVMPGINGRELSERLTLQRPGLLTLYMSGYTENVIENHGVLERGTNFIQKPFRVDDLLRRVQALLKQGASLTSL